MLEITCNKSWWYFNSLIDNSNMTEQSFDVPLSTYQIISKTNLSRNLHPSKHISFTMDISLDAF